YAERYRNLPDICVLENLELAISESSQFSDKTNTTRASLRTENRELVMMKPVKTTASQTGHTSEVEPLLLEVADVVNTTLDLETTLRRVAELVRKVIDYEIFAILLLNEPLQELYVRFHVGYPQGIADRLRVKVGQGVT